MKKLIITFLVLVCAGAVRAGIHTQVVEYKQGDTTLEGFVAYDDAIKAVRPGVLVVHQWLGLTDYEKKRAEMLAQLGYVAFCADIYGKGVRAQNTQEASALAGQYKGNSDGPPYAEWAMMTHRIPLKEYRDEVVSQFNPQEFDADEWARIFKASGMRYVVITSKHHDGFALFKSEASISKFTREAFPWGLY